MSPGVLTESAAFGLVCFFVFFCRRQTFYPQKDVYVDSMSLEMIQQAKY